MVKMTKTQRTAILDFHNGVTSKQYWAIASRARTAAVLVREGWATYPGHVSEGAIKAGRVRTFNVTRAGLIAAGVDMDAIHAEALMEYREVTRAARRADSAAYHHLLAAQVVGTRLRPLGVDDPHSAAFGLTPRT